MKFKNNNISTITIEKCVMEFLINIDLILVSNGHGSDFKQDLEIVHHSLEVASRCHYQSMKPS